MGTVPTREMEPSPVGIVRRARGPRASWADHPGRVSEVPDGQAGIARAAWPGHDGCGHSRRLLRSGHRSRSGSRVEARSPRPAITPGLRTALSGFEGRTLGLSRFRRSGHRFGGKNLRKNKKLSGRSVGLPTVHDIEESGGHHAGVPPPFPDDWSVSGRRSGIQQRTCREAAQPVAPSQTMRRFAAFRAGFRISFRFASVVRKRGWFAMGHGSLAARFPASVVYRVACQRKSA